ncbi:hypothetical protein BGX28_005101 [Mortierella sp. GBA30]|nr:hypothetical protein BGX28_005101 [Mortierella sp. GBA30]
MLETRPQRPSDRPGGDNQIAGSGLSARTSQDLLGGTSSVMDPNRSGELAYGRHAMGAGATAGALGAERMYGHWEEADHEWPQQQYHPSTAPDQRVSYNPPMEPDMSQAGDRYDPEYAARREQEAAAYAQYLSYPHQQMYPEHAGAADPGYYADHDAYAGHQDSYYYDQHYPAAHEQDHYLQRLRQEGYDPEGAGDLVTSSIPSTQQQHGYSNTSDYDRDVRYAKDEPWPTPPPPVAQSSSTLAPFEAEDEGTQTAHIEGGASGSGAPMRSSLLPSTSASGSDPRRVNSRISSPQLVSSPKRAPQSLRPDPEPSH